MSASMLLSDARIALERQGMVLAGSVDTGIAESWRRCLDRGVSPFDAPRTDIIDAPDLEARRAKYALARRLALAEMQVLHAQIAGTNFMIAFADPDGVVLDTLSDHHFAESRDGTSIIPGSIWKEERQGTNALGLALVESGPVAIYGREHFFLSQAHLSCMAAPIVDTNGDLVGILDASCSNDHRQQHTHALVRMAASQIENGLIFQERADHLILAFHPRIEFLDTLSAGLIAVTGDGELRALNRQSRALLLGIRARIGGSFEDVFDARFGKAMTKLLGGGVIQLRDQAGSAVFMVCRQIGRLGRPALAQSRHASPIAPVPETSDVGFVCDDMRLRRAMAEIAGATAKRMPVHIHGETGTGKELMARYVHTASGRQGEFVAINCGAIAESLFVAELFGHEHGAFTNARSDGSPGLVRVADGGTLFLDEVADIPLTAQTALLRFLDTMEIRAVGGQRSVTVDVQIVSATNKDLKQAIADKTFRPDLYYRLTALGVQLPPLRERTDFPAIVRYHMGKVAPGVAITDEAIETLRARPFGGNIRELLSVLQRVVIEMETDFLDETAFDTEGTAAGDACPTCRTHPLNAYKCRQIREVYQASGYNIAITARTLGVARNTIYKHIQER